MNLPGAVADQYQALTTECGFVRLDRTQLELTGKDRAAVLHNLTTNEVKRLQPGDGCEAFVTNVQGKTLGHIFISCGDDRFLLDTTPGQASTVLAHFDRYTIIEDAALTDRSQDWVEILLAGPQLEQRMSELGWSLPTEMHAHYRAAFDGSWLLVRRVPWTPHAVSLTVEQPQAESLVRSLEQADIKQCQWEALDVARLEHGFPLYGQDIDQKNLPQEVDRNALAISFVKGCYLGQETVARLDALGHVNRTLCRVKFSGNQFPDRGLALVAGQKQVGQVTSAVWSPKFDAPLALGYVRRGVNEPGSELQSEVGPAVVLDAATPDPSD